MSDEVTQPPSPDKRAELAPDWLLGFFVNLANSPAQIEVGVTLAVSGLSVSPAL